MVKIKSKKVFTHRELLKFLIDREDTRVELDSCSEVNGKIKLRPRITCEHTFKSMGDNLFEVDIEEEVTDQTVIPKLIEYRDSGYVKLQNHSIKELKSDLTEAIYMINDNFTITLLWTKQGGLVK